MPRIKSSEERLKIIDQLIGGKTFIADREKLLDFVNDQIDDPIGKAMLDKDLKELKALADTEDVKLSWTRTLGYHYSKPDYRYYQKALTDDDKVMLVLAQNLFQTFKQTSLKEKFRELVEKLIANDGSVKYWNDAKSQKFIQPEWDNESAGNKWLPELINAIHEKKQIGVTYNKEKKQLSPYVLKQNKGLWYLVAYDHDKKGEEAIKIYSLNRIQQILPGKFEYYKDPTFKPEDYFKYSLGIWHRYDTSPIKVILEFNHPRLIETIQQNKIHPTQQIIKQTNKSLRIELTVYDTVELDGLILGYGENVKLISPKHLKERLKDKIRELSKLYMA
ncbi:MAG TPA: WYL domain-containing protein [Chitinophagaceae bacterium]|nr:WYL domain-containing protein [Chitinophagaceae bacterium]